MPEKSKENLQFAFVGTFAHWSHQRVTSQFSQVIFGQKKCAKIHSENPEEKPISCEPVK